MQDFWDTPNRHFGRFGRRARHKRARHFTRLIVRHFVRQLVRQLARYVMQQILHRTAHQEYDYRTNPGAALRWLVEHGHVQYRGQGVPQIERVHGVMETGR